MTTSHASRTPSGDEPEEIADPGTGAASPPRAENMTGVRTADAPGSPAQLAAEAAAGLDEEVIVEDVVLGAAGVRQLRPVPQLAGPPIAPRTAPIPARPVYDPFSARRRRAPEWLVSYTAALVVGDFVAAGLGATAALVLPVGGGVPATRLLEVVVGCWALVLCGLGAYAERRMGTGSDEYRRVLVGGLAAIALLGFTVHSRRPAGWNGCCWWVRRWPPWPRCSAATSTAAGCTPPAAAA